MDMSEPFAIFDGPIPWLKRAEMLELDRLMVEELGIGHRQMMELAGRHAAVLAQTRFLGRPEGRRVRVLAGAGHNGGVALIAARRLAGWDAHVEIVLTAAEVRLRPHTAALLAICRRLEIPVTRQLPDTPDAGDDLVIDGVVGCALIGPLRGAGESATRWANTSVSPVLALDLPSGLDPDMGPVDGIAIRATATLALAAPKRGLKHPAASIYVGELFVADIGVPPGLFENPGVSRSQETGPTFGDGDLLRLPLGSPTRH